MTAVNRGKRFELQVRKGFERVKDCSVIRLYDPVGGAVGVRNICDFIVYKYPYQYLLECKSVHGDRFPLSNITDTQWDGLCKMLSKPGVVPGVLCWYVDRDVTVFLPIVYLDKLSKLGVKSVRYDSVLPAWFKVPGAKKRIFYEYDMAKFFKQVEENIHERV